MIDIILRATLTAAVAQGTPLLLTALGEIMNQRAGVLNLGLDGMMLFGAVTAFISLIASGSLFVAVLVGGVCAALLALIHAFLSITCRVHQVICGLALNIFAAGFSAFVGKDYNGIAAPKVLENIRIPLLADIPYLGEIFFNQNLLVYLSYALVIVLSFVMFRTQIGLKMRACGENPPTRFRAHCTLLNALFRLALATPPVLKTLSSQRTIARRTVLQKVPYHPLTGSMCL